MAGATRLVERRTLPLPPIGATYARVRLRCQDAKGAVDPNKLSILKQWDRLHKDQRRLEAVLVDLKKEFAKPEYKKNVQPPDGATYN